MNLQKFIFWAPRVLTIIFILFLSLFALDVFQPGQSIPYMIAGFLIHLIPCYILTAVLLISWRYEFFGVVFILLGILYMIIIWTRGLPFFAFPTISGSAFLIGGLFLLNWKTKSRSNRK